MADSAAALPGISIILAIRNEAEHLEDCLRALVNLDYPQDKIEILLIDGMSDDATPQIISEWVRLDSRISTFTNTRKMVSPGLNLGLSVAKNDYILWISGHAIVQPGHVRACLETMRSTGAAAVGGVMNTHGTTTVGRINAAVLSHPFGVGGGEHRIGGRSGWVTVVTMALYRKEAILAAGGFDESLPRSQDNDLHDRMNKLGLRSYLNVEINPTYLCRNTLKGLLRQAWNNGFWNIMLSRRGHGGFSVRHFVPMAFVGGQVALLLGGLILPLLFWLLAAGLAVYLLCAFAVSVAIVVKHRMSWQIFALPIWFAALHYTYGVASWSGLLRSRDFDRKRPE
jgi:succinoglycan biosynthesis protein ExoA